MGEPSGLQTHIRVKENNWDTNPGQLRHPKRITSNIALSSVSMTYYNMIFRGRKREKLPDMVIFHISHT